MEPIEGSDIEELLGRVGSGARTLVAAATRAIVARLGERGSCILVDDRPRVVYSTESPDLVDLPLDPARYPEIRAALDSGDVVAIENVSTSSLLRPVAHLLPPHLGAVVAVPLRVGRRNLGVITVRSSAPRSMAERDLAAARLDGRVAATLLDLQFGGELRDRLVPAPASQLALALALAPASISASASASTLASSPQPALAAMPVASADRRRILIADDDETHGAMLKDVLEDEGFDVVLVGDGAEALHEARRQRPDLALLDVYMPVRDGFQVARELLGDSDTASIPVVFISAADDLVSRVRELQLEAVDFLRKPYSLGELLTRIDKSLCQARSREHLRHEATIDELTGLGNLRFLRQHLGVEQSRIARHGGQFAVVMVDVDKLKLINDRHGHPAGSRILKEIGRTLRSEIRDTDVAARYGGDEFVVLLPHTGLAEGGTFAERVLSRIRDLRPEGVDVSLSLGVAALEVPGRASVEALLGEADAAAYRAKRSGGNRVCLHDPKLDLHPPRHPTPVAPLAAAPASPTSPTLPALRAAVRVR